MSHLDGEKMTNCDPDHKRLFETNLNNIKNNSNVVSRTDYMETGNSSKLGSKNVIDLCLINYYSYIY